MKEDNSQLIFYGIAALIASVFIYNFWQFMLGALALCGAAFVIREYNRNKLN